MKVYYFMIIAIGLMYSFHLAGIETGSSKILTLLESDNPQNSTLSGDINYSKDYSVSDIYSASSFWKSLTIALFVLMTIAAFGAVKIAGIDTSSVVYSITAGIAFFLFLMLTYDFYSVLRYMHQITGGTGWQYYLTWIIIVPILAGFLLSLIEFVQGRD